MWNIKGRLFKLFPKNNKSTQEATSASSPKIQLQTPELTVPNVFSNVANTEVVTAKKEMQRILIVEDNDELRSYLVSLLSPQYYVQACCNGREALVIVKEFWPELILS